MATLSPFQPSSFSAKCTRNEIRNAFQTFPLEQPVTHKELEDAEQQRLRYRPFSVEEEQLAANWWASRILCAEAFTGNTEASQRPAKYLQTVKSRVMGNEDVLLGVVEEWRKAADAGTLNEPIWSEATKPTKVRVMPPAAARAAVG